MTTDHRTPDSNDTTDTGTDHPAIGSLKDLVPSFPLEPDERIYDANGVTGAEIITPTGIKPATGRKRAETIRFYVTYLVHEVTGRDKHGRYVIGPNSHRTGKDTIGTFEKQIAAGEVIRQREDFTVAPTTPAETTPETVTATLHFDGASRGNPGDAATGYVLNLPSTTVQDGRLLDDHTNNEAEYKSLIDGLRNALDADVTDITIKGDSQLIIRQVTGEYDCNAENLLPLYDTVTDLLAEFNEYTIKHVPRDENSKADAAANDVLDAA